MGRKSQFTQEQIIPALQEVDAGAKPEEVCRRLGVSDTTFYRWKSKYGGMDVSEAKRLKELETENARLKKLVAEQALDLEAVRSVLKKNGEALGRRPSRGLRTGELLLERASSMPGAGILSLQPSVLESTGGVECITRPAPSARRSTTPVRLPPAAPAAPAGRGRR